jgi:hypothetical protein
MIISDEEAAKRLSSPMNLINRLRSSSPRSGAMSLFGVNKSSSFLVPEKQTLKIETARVENITEASEISTSKFEFNPFDKLNKELTVLPKQVQTIPQQASNPDPVKLDNLLDNSDSQIKLGLAHDSALSLLTDSITAMQTKLDDVKADKLPSVISAASKVVEGIRRERNEANKNQQGKDVHYHFYTPIQRKVEEFEVIEVS